MNIQCKENQNWLDMVDKNKKEIQSQTACFKFKYRFTNPDEEITVYCRDFVEKTIAQSLRQVYGIIGMGRFDIKLSECLDSVTEIKMPAAELIDFWTAMIMNHQMNGIKYRLYAVSLSLDNNQIL